MCGRVSLFDAESLNFWLEELELPELPPRYNIAPSAELPLLVARPQPELRSMVWGFIPPWAKPGQFKSPLINARAESVRDKPSFRNLVVHQRAVLLVNGFFEWQRVGRAKQPFYITSNAGVGLAMAALYQRSHDGSEHFVIVTTQAQGEMAEVHDRMPLLLQRAELGAWLQSDDRLTVDALLQSPPQVELALTPVSSVVNSAAHDSADCITPQLL